MALDDALARAICGLLEIDPDVAKSVTVTCVEGSPTQVEAVVVGLDIGEYRVTVIAE